MRIPVLLAALCLALTAKAGAAADGIGSVTRLQGGAQANRNGGEVTLSLGTEIFQDEKLTTGAKTRLEVTFIDGTKVTVGENASLTVDRFLYRPRGLGNVFNAAVSG